MRALSIRQPFAELILRGTKTVEYRSRPTRVIGERFWIYASRQPAVTRGRGGAILGRARDGVWSRELAVPDEPLPPWMIELAEGLRLWKPGELPTGVIVGSAVIERCSGPIPPATGDPQATTVFRWHLGGVERLAQPRQPIRQPQPVWFQPF